MWLLPRLQGDSGPHDLHSGAGWSTWSRFCCSGGWGLVCFGSKILHGLCGDSDGFFCWSSDEFCIGITVLRFWWIVHMFCWDSDGFCICFVEILMGSAWVHFQIWWVMYGIVLVILMGFICIIIDFCWILHCPVSSWKVEWPSEDMKPRPLSYEAKAAMRSRRESLMWGSDPRLWCSALLIW